MAKSYNEILKEYPEYIAKEQFYQICHVSKKTALYYLESGLIPCVDSGKKTRRFTIATKDVVQFLKNRDKDPEEYRAQPGWYKGKGNRNLPYRIVRTKRSKKNPIWMNTFSDSIAELPQKEDCFSIDCLKTRWLFSHLRLMTLQRDGYWSQADS